jgi:7-cyano-7-deazaguanine synthase
MSASAARPAAVVLLSGGMDSAVVLAHLRYEGFDCHALSFDYGQRHRVELERATEVAKALGAASHRCTQRRLAQHGRAARRAERVARARARHHGNGRHKLAQPRQSVALRRGEVQEHLRKGRPVGRHAQ